MSTVEVAAGELTGAALDWAVGVIEGGRPVDGCRLEWTACGCAFSFTPGMSNNPLNLERRGFGWCPTTQWDQGGPLLHKHAVALEPADAWQEYGNNWQATCITTRADADHSFHHQQGETPLIAGMRAIVGAILGDTVSIPTELLEQSA